MTQYVIVAEATTQSVGRAGSRGASRPPLRVPRTPSHIAAEPGAEVTLCGLSTEAMEEWGPYPSQFSRKCPACKAQVPPV